MKNDKKKTKSFERPVADVIAFEVEDIITDSNGNGDDADDKDMD